MDITFLNFSFILLKIWKLITFSWVCWEDWKYMHKSTVKEFWRSSWNWNRSLALCFEDIWCWDVEPQSSDLTLKPPCLWAPGGARAPPERFWKCLHRKFLFCKGEAEALGEILQQIRFLQTPGPKLQSPKKGLLNTHAHPGQAAVKAKSSSCESSDTDFTCLVFVPFKQLPSRERKGQRKGGERKLERGYYLDAGITADLQRNKG